MNLTIRVFGIPVLSIDHISDDVHIVEQSDHVTCADITPHFGFVPASIEYDEDDDL